MLQNESVNAWLKLIKTNSTNIMQTLAEKRLNPNNYHLSSEAEKRLRWLYLLYHEEKGNVSKTARKIGLSRQWLSHLKQIFEHNNKDPRCLEPESRAPNNTSKRNRIPEDTERLIIKIRDEELKKEMIFHFYSNAGTPTDNPRVERSHLTDDLEFYNKSNTFNNLDKQKEKLRGGEG